MDPVVLQTALKGVSNYHQYFEPALVPWVHYVPIGHYDPDDIIPVRLIGVL